MQLTRAIPIMGRNDAKLIGRDSFLVGLVAYMIALAFINRWALPWLAGVVDASEAMTFDLRTYFPLILGYLVVFAGGMVAGTVIAFVVLDERDDHTLVALLVTPLSARNYLMYRLLISWLVSVLIGVANIAILMPLLGVDPVLMIPVVVAASLLSPLTMSIVATMAGNKVEGFALLKIVGSAGLLIFAAWFVPGPAEWLFGLFPPYWFNKAYWMLAEGSNGWPLALLGGVITTGAALVFFVRRFVRVVYKDV